MSVNTSSGDHTARESSSRTTSLLAPSKFSSNFMATGSSGNGTAPVKASDPPKPFFAGFKASKLSSVTQSLSSEPSSSEPSSSLPAAPSNLTFAWSGQPKEEEASSEKHHLFLPLDTRPASLATRESPAKPDSVSNGSSESISNATESTNVSDVTTTDTGSQESLKSSPPKRTLSERNDEPDASPKRIKIEDPEKTEANTSDGKSEGNCSSPPKPETLSSFVFGENLTSRADNFQTLSSGGFVFGQNLTERAENFTPEPKDEKEEATSSSATPQPTSSSVSESKPSPKSLSESAAAYYESHATPKRKYDQVAVVTGEEGEVNVVQMSAKLYWFDKGNWTERGRGILRLNDIAEVNSKTSAPPSASRLVMRTVGSLRVILNTKLYRGMPVELPADKNLRLTGLDDAGKPRVFLVTGSAKDISNMHAALTFRLDAMERASRSDGSKVSDSDTEDDEDCSKIKAPRLL